MGSPERSRSYSKRDAEDYPDMKSERALEDEDCEESEKRKHRSSKSRKHSNGEEIDGYDGSGRRKSSRERNERRKRSSGGGLGRTGSDDEDDHDTKKDSRSKQIKKKQEESALEKLSSWYQDGDLESKSGSRLHNRADEIDRSSSRKTSSKFPDQEGSHTRSKGKDEKSYDKEPEKLIDRDSKYSERRESSREKGHKRRWDESDSTGKVEEHNNYMEKDDGRDGERSGSARVEYSETKAKGLDSNRDKGSKSNSKEERRVDDSEKSNKSRGRSEVTEEDNKGSPISRGKDRSEKHKQQRSSSQSGRVPDVSRRSRTPERIGRRHQELDNSEMDNERSSALKRKELENDNIQKDDKIKSRDENWSERMWDNREGSKEIWKRRQQSSNDRESKEGDVYFDHRHQGRSGNRKDGRTEAVKTSSNFGISTENYDVIEIQPKPLDYGREESGPTFSRRGDDSKSALNDDEWAYTQEDRAKGGRVPGQSSIQEQGSYRSLSQGVKGNRVGGRGGRGRSTGRENQHPGIPLPLMGSQFGPIGLPPPGPLTPLTPSLSPAPGPPISPGVFIPPFSPPVMWAARGLDMNMLAVPPGPSGPRFSPSIVTPPNPASMYFNQPGSGRGGPPTMPGPGFNTGGSMGRGPSQEKASSGWAPARTGGPHGKAPSRGEQNDYSQNFVDTGMRPQNFIRELELTNVVEDYPKLRELIQKKDEIVAKSASPPMYYKCDLREHVLSPEFFKTKFDVILVDPPWEEYVHRAPGVADHMEYWTFEEILNLKIEAIADTPSFIFLWVGDGVGLEQGRQCLKKWGFRRCEDICWVKTNKTNPAPGLRHDSHTLFQHSKEHCLMGIKGTVRRSTDGHIIHANIDTDVIIAEEPPYGSTAKPEDMYRIIEHFALGRRRLELFGEDHNIRSGWLTVGKGLSSSNFNSEAYIRNFADKDGKVWQGGGGRNPPPEAPHLVVTTPDIEALRPKSPMKNQQQLQQQQSASISITTVNSSNKRPGVNSPQNPNPFSSMNQEASSSNPPMPSWASSPMEGFKGQDSSGNMGMEDKVFDIYGYNMHTSADYLDFESQRATNML